MPEQAPPLTPLQQALVALRELRSRLDASERARHEPIAVIGIGCRFPGGADSPDAFWRLLSDGVDAVTDVPTDRWDVGAHYDPDPTAPGKMATRWGSFLTGVDQFDARFFGLSRRETVSMDPQQRLLLEVAWETLEHAGLAPDQLAGSPTGVFVGLCNTDYAQLVGRSIRSEPYMATGNTASVAAGRVSYVLGLQGPSLAVDTACSSSLVAIHLACQSLRSGESRLALAGGANLMLSPVASVALSQLQIMSPDGRCKTFDAAANGIVRGEGCALVALKRLSDAEADGDTVLAVIRGTAVNQDGRSAGLTAPNGPAQEAVIRAALGGTGILPTDVDYVETHGTATALGDPIEVRALANVLGPGRPAAQPLYIGSIKTNFGHTEATAGVAGLIKLVLALQHAEIPPHLHFRDPSPHIPWADIPVRVPSGRTPWPAGTGRRIAGVSSFGFSGTNAHVVLEGAGVSPAAPAEAVPPSHLLTLSAKSAPALADLAGRYLGHFRGTPDLSLTDACYTASTGRAQLAERLAVVAGSVDEMAERLAAFVAGQTPAGLVVGRAEATAPRVAFMFGDRPTRPVYAARQLYQTEPTFRAALDRAADILAVHLPHPLTEILFPVSGVLLPESDPSGDLAHFALQCALADLWRSWGIVPRALLGQGVGQYAAGVAGGLALDVAAKLLMARMPLPARPPADRAIPVAVVHGENVAAALRSLRDQGCTHVVEVGPVRGLDGRGRGFPADSDLCWLPSFAPSDDGSQQIMQSLGILWVAGAPVDWNGFYRGRTRRKIALPTYPFQRERYWVEVAATDAPPVNGSATPVGERRPEVGSYELRWQPKPAEAPRPGAPGRWLVFADRGGVGEAFARQVAASGARALMVKAGPQFARLGEDRWQIDPSNLPDFGRLWQEVSSDAGLPWHGAVYLWGLDDGPAGAPSANDPMAASVWSCGGLLHLVQTLVGAEGAPRVWVATRGAQAVSDDSPPLAVEQAPLWGLGRVIALEHPELWGGAVDLDPASTDAGELLAVLQQADGEDQIAMRAGVRLVARIVATTAIELNRQPTESAPAPVADHLTLSADATYLVAGGLGALGLHVAGRLVERGARNLALIGRRAPSSEVAATLDALRQRGARVEVVQADLADEQALSGRLNEALSQLPPLRGVIHAAGVLDDGILLNQTQERFASVFAPKVQGAWNLHRLTRDLPLDFFVLFSSAASLLGSPGQGNYAAANAFLDALAQHRRSLNLPATSINWGPWADAGMAASDASRWSQRGMEPLQPAVALAALERMLTLGLTQVTVLDADWPSMLARLPGHTPPPLLSDVAAASPSGPAAEDDPTFDLLLGAAPEERPNLVRDYLRRELARVLGASEADMSTDANLIELGLDSLMVMDLINAVKRSLRLTLYPREIYEQPTIAVLSAYLSAEFGRATSEAGGASHATVASSGDAILAEGDSPFTFAVGPARADASPLHRLDQDVVLLLSSPRSGSTLLRVMLAGHPDLFAPPELHLLPFATMSERQARLQGSYLGEGLQRAIMELRGCDASSAKLLVDDLAAHDLPVSEVYRLLQSEAAPRTLVDKSPTYAGSLPTLRRADALFERAKLVHLVRHPYAVIESFARMRMHRLVGADDVDPYVLAEEIWTSANANLLRFRAECDPSRYHLMQYERLVAEPAAVMAELCRFLDIPFHEAVLNPYDGERMTDGVSERSAPIGDPRFGEHDSIDAQLGETWRAIRLPRPLKAETRRVATELGYELPVEGALPATPIVAPASTMREQYRTPRGTRLCLCTWGPEHGKPVVCLHGILEHGAAWDGVGSTLGARGYHVVAPDQRGHGRSAHVGPGGSYHLIDFVADLDALLREMALGPVTLVGHSFGAMVAALLASARPELVDTLILIEPPLLAPPNVKNPAAGLAVQLDYLAEPPAHPVLPDLAAAADRLRRATPTLSGEQAHAWAVRLTEPYVGGVRWRWDSLLSTRAGLGFEGAGDATALLAGLRVPLTLVGGADSDPRTIEGLASLAAGLSEVRLVTLPGGHHLHIEAPGALADLIADVTVGRVPAAVERGV